MRGKKGTNVSIGVLMVGAGGASVLGETWVFCELPAIGFATEAFGSLAEMLGLLFRETLSALFLPAPSFGLCALLSIENQSGSKFLLLIFETCLLSP